MSTQKKAQNQNLCRKWLIFCDDRTTCDIGTFFPSTCIRPDFTADTCHALKY